MAKEKEQEKEPITRCYAVPDYLTPLLAGQDIPPGHRFGLYFKGWQRSGTTKDDWALNKEQKSEALKDVTQLGNTAAELSKNLLKRQSTLKGQMPEQVFHLHAKNTSPFITGMGNEHPVENGFAFLPPYGVPYLAGSGIKGMLLRAAKYLAFNQRDNWSDAAINVLFGSADMDEAGNPIKGQQGALRFWDCFPQVANSQLAVEIMTPHNGDYLQGDSTPHTSGQPVPIPFLAIPPESAFDFFIQADLARLDQALKSHWQTMLKAAFTTLFEFVGMGAKTAVGYGQMQKLQTPEEVQQERKLKEEEESRQREARLEQEGYGKEKIDEQGVYARLEGSAICIQDKNTKLIATFHNAKTIWDSLPDDILATYKKKKKPIKVTASYVQQGNNKTLTSLTPEPDQAG
ncbi:hypothetical protein WH50_17745 [Pokkaliibacter plantistimulans]|uniref:CRISPR type III-associated protein domain-containing protein n=1 Tax=Pokkaliibacter plantistimulans TaxID=1635171 RepID=A0ABX5LWT6_9GAMM|nr:type III-B CRISPR module RAMP protein Cmr6 [Pokkaliibacter plantistimulans]PXF29963.1 hypothetical protein WH50_17745 [Pokkaliibacter plantistimulans]